MRQAPIIAAFLGAILVATYACRTPTEVTLDISTNAACGDLGPVVLTVAVSPDVAESRVASGFPTTTSTSCDPGGNIGSLVVTPGGAGGAVVVVAGFGGSKESDCTPPLYKGCIVARRTFGFVTHTAVHLPIVLDENCVGVPCDATSTCIGKACVDSHVDCSSDDTCSTPGASDGGVVLDGSTPPHPDAGDASPGDDGGSDVDAASFVGQCPTGNLGCAGATMVTDLSCQGDGSNAQLTCCSDSTATTCSTVGACSGVANCCTGSNECATPGDICCSNTPTAIAGSTLVACAPAQACAQNGGGSTFICSFPENASPACPLSAPNCGSGGKFYIGPNANFTLYICGN